MATGAWGSQGPFSVSIFDPKESCLILQKKLELPNQKMFNLIIPQGALKHRSCVSSQWKKLYSMFSIDLNPLEM